MNSVTYRDLLAFINENPEWLDAPVEVAVPMQGIARVEALSYTNTHELGHPDCMDKPVIILE